MTSFATTITGANITAATGATFKCGRELCCQNGVVCHGCLVHVIAADATGTFYPTATLSGTFLAGPGTIQSEHARIRKL